MSAEPSSNILQLYLTAMATSEVYESLTLSLFRQAGPEQRCLFNLTAEGLHALRAGLEELTYAELRACHGSPVDNTGDSGYDKHENQPLR